MAGRPDPFSRDTIAAIATAPGQGAVAIVRLSGERSLAVLSRISPTTLESPLSPRRPRLLPLVNPASGELLDRALVTYFPAPRSYTGEDSVELSTHGGLLTPQLVLDAAITAGARIALPGEFTRRALMNGKLDLVQAEAIADLVQGGSAALHRVAVHQLEGGLSRRIDELRAAILHTSALVAYGIDFPDEDEPPVPIEQVLASAEDTRGMIEAMLGVADQGAMLRDGALVVLAGRPNAGKSSLFNALLGFERSIVTDVPGTTRDAVEAHASIRGYPFRLVDTAGLRDSADRVERIGVEVAHRYLDAADIVLYCIDAASVPDRADDAFLGRLPSDRVLVVRTRADLVDDESRKEGELVVSAVTGEGLAAVGDELVRRSFGLIRNLPDDAPLVTRARHARALREAAKELAEFTTALREGIPAELAATHLTAAISHLEDIIGIVGTEDLLDAVFSEFCVGK